MKTHGGICHRCLHKGRNVGLSTSADSLVGPLAGCPRGRQDPLNLGSVPWPTLHMRQQASHAGQHSRSQGGDGEPAAVHRSGHATLQGMQTAVGEHRPRPAESSAARNPERQKEPEKYYCLLLPRGPQFISREYDIRDRLSLLWILGIIEGFLFLIELKVI